MKYKHIKVAIHNFGASFMSSMNYVDNDFVRDELVCIHSKGNDIEINWLTGYFSPKNLATSRIHKSIRYWRDSLEKHLASENVDLTALAELKFCWPARGRKFMVAVDNRGKEHRIYINETK